MKPGLPEADRLRQGYGESGEAVRAKAEPSGLPVVPRACQRWRPTCGPRLRGRASRSSVAAGGFTHDAGAWTP